VIPTRNGGVTLPFTLQTCLAQKHDNYEIIVSDNASEPSVKQTVDSLADSRIRYHRSDTVLAMTDSWEFAVSKASGEYVIVLGDDDGLLLHALAEVDRILELTQATALRWECGHYFWPGVGSAGSWYADDLIIPTNQVHCGHLVYQYEAGPLIQDAASSHLPYINLPVIYCGAIHASLIARAREQTGRVFHGRYPDVYSAFAFAHLAGTYYSADAPMCLRGTSKKSTGYAYFLATDSSVAKEFHALNRQASYARTRGIPDVPVMAAVVADGFEHARTRLFPEMPSVDRKLLIQNCLHGLILETEQDWRSAYEILRGSLSDDPELLAWFESICAERPFAPTAPFWKSRQERDQPDCWLYLDAAAFGAQDIFAAAQLSEKILHFTPNGCSSRLDSVPSRRKFLDPGLAGVLREYGVHLGMASERVNALTAEVATWQSRSVPAWRRVLAPVRRLLRAFLPGARR
jgi:hypothetical protein